MPGRRTIGLSLSAALLLSFSLHAADPPLSPVRIAALLTQLGSPDPEMRDAADLALQGLGTDVLKPLREARQHADPEVRRRVRLLIQDLEPRAEAERLFRPTRFRLVFRDTPLVQAANELGRQAGFFVRLEGDKISRKVTLDTGETTLWEALARFERVAELTERPQLSGSIDVSAYDPYDRRVLDLSDVRGETEKRLGNLLILRDGASPALPVFQNGALRIRALPPDGRGLRTAGEVRIDLELRLEPRLRLEAVLGLRIDRAFDDNDQTLSQPAAAIAGAGAFAGGPGDEVLLAWDGDIPVPVDLPTEAGPVPVRLRLGSRPSQRLKELRGTLALRVLAPEETLITLNEVQTVGNAARGPDGSGLRVLEYRQEAGKPNKLRVEVVPAARELFLAGVPARILHVTEGRWRGRGLPVPAPVTAGQLSVFDDRGRKVPVLGAPIPTVGSNGAAWDFVLEMQSGSTYGAPARLVYTGRRSITVEAPFTLTDVPLPELPVKKEKS